jgi:hypothetical protein
VFEPLVSLFRLILGWLTCKIDAEGNVVCDLFDSLQWFLDMLANFPDFDLDFIIEFFRGLLAFFDLDFEIDWNLDWFFQVPNIIQWVSGLEWQTAVPGTALPYGP